MKNYKALWLTLVLCVGFGFFILGFFGKEVYRQAPPIPSQVITHAGTELYNKETILDGQQVWQSIGGQQVGSIWGHGAYQAPDWSADWLHREANALLNIWSLRQHSKNFDEITAEQRAKLEASLRLEIRKNTFDEESGVVTISEDRAAAITVVAKHYTELFGGDESLAELRESYALQEKAIKDPERLAAISAFFFWTSWSCITERPGESYTYTNNWPHDPQLGNTPTGSNILWSLVSIFLLLAAVGALAWLNAAQKKHDEPHQIPQEDPLKAITITPSMRALGKYVAVVAALFLVQVLLGALTAHYTVEGDSFFGLPINEWLPYAISRTWHIQTGLFWIATSFLAAGLFFAPIIGGKDPKFQVLGVNVLFGALLVVVAGSLAGQFFSVHQMMDLDLSFWFGHQGYEYVDLGRGWQVALFAGLVIWLLLVSRAVLPALKIKAENRSLIALFFSAMVAIGLFYGVGFMYGARTHLSVAEYWRWWVIHLWVEGFFEVFATAALAFLFTKLGLVSVRSATRAALASTSIFLVSGIPGTFHHLYFSGTPVSVSAIGAIFSALEVVPLVLLGKEAVETMHLQTAAPWMKRYRWPIKFFVGVIFWNMVGAGLFGFLINPPISLYFMQGLNTTPVHAHTALFGVYGLMSLGLVLLISRKICRDKVWKEGHLKIAFWSLNIGLGLMVALSLLPIGIAQTFASVEHGLWYARSAEFLQQPWIEQLRWLRIIGDTVFLIGVASLTWFFIGLKTGHSFSDQEQEAPVSTNPAGQLPGLAKEAENN